MNKPINLNTKPAQSLILHEPALNIPDIKDPETAAFIEDMLETVKSVPTAVGLASNQIWDREIAPPAVFVARLGVPKEEWTICINPRLIKVWGPSKWVSEGCLSLPGKVKKVKRWRRATLTFIGNDGELRENQEFMDFSAQVVQHEMDHLMGNII